MADGLHNLKRDRIIRAFERAGWRVKEGKKHTLMEKEGYRAVLSIPRHKVIKRGLLLRQIEVAGLTVEEFLRFYKGKK